MADKSEDKYYTYAYLDDDNKPYYVGKGSGNRAYYKGDNEKVKAPESRDKIIFLKKNISEPDAYKHESYMIAVLGRKHLGGLLENVHPGFTNKKPQKTKSGWDKTNKIFLEKKEDLIEAFKLMADQVNIEDYIDSLIEDIKSNFGPTPFNIFRSYYSVKDTIENRKAFDDSFLGNFDDMKIEFNINDMLVEETDYYDKKKIVDSLLSNRIIWEKDGYYFRKIKIYPDDMNEDFLKLLKEFERLAE
jgi:hypothetical protein